jgi:hypothetical protein
VASYEPADAAIAIDFTTSDPGELPRLREWLRGQGGAEVSYRPSAPAVGELGASDVLTVLAGSSVLATVIKTLPDFLRSRRSGLRIHVTVGEKKVELDATNVDDALRIVERLLDDGS